MADEKKGQDGLDSDPADTSSIPQKQSKFTPILSLLPEWVTTNLRSKNSWKLLARCWLASWVSFLIILPDRSLRTLGNASFLAFISSLMLPPNMPVQLFFFAMSTVLIGMLLGWGIGAAAMRAALAARDQVLLRQSLLAVQQSAAGAANPDAQFQLELFQGAFLDTRSSVVYGCFLGFAAFVFGLLRAYAPKLTILSVFGTVVADVYCSYGPLFPFGQYTLVNSLLISTSCYMAIAIVCIIFIFPETMNHSYLASVTSMLGDTRAFFDLHGQVLDLTPEDVRVDRDGTLAKGKGLQEKLMAGIQELEAKTTFINGEFSWGRWNGDDVKALGEPLKIMLSRINGFHSFVRLLDPSRVALISGSTAPRSEVSSASSSIDEPTADTELIRQLLSRHQDLEEKHNLRITDVLPIVKDSTSDLRAGSAEALDAVQALLEEINSFRWRRGSSRFTIQEARLQEAVNRLRAALSAFKSTERFAILQPFVPVLRSLHHETERHKRRGVPIRSLTITSVYAAHTILSAEAILTLVDLVINTSHRRRKSRLWAPSKLRALGRALFKRESGNVLNQQLGEEKPLKPDREENEERLYRRDPDSRPPTNAVQKVMNGIHSVYRWLKTPEAIFTVKYVVITIALWLPSVFRSSAYFAYVQKSVWALIMAQTTLNIYVADQIYSYVARIIGTVLGLAVGLAAWYIGNGSGNGNVYGSAASIGVILVPLVFFRAFAPMTQIVPIVMFTVTMALIVGYSWIDGHLFTVGNPGIGWHIAWKRFVLVMVGSAASFILMFLPPTSGRKAVRMRNALIITELSNLYAFLMSSWIEKSKELQAASSADEDGDGTTSPDPSKDRKHKPDWLTECRVRSLSIAAQIQTLRAETAVARWEGNIRGAWPSEEYNKLADREWDMLTALAQLGGALIHLDPVWKGSSSNQRTRVLNPNFFTDVMTIFALVSQSLRTGEPLHQVIPTSLLDRLLYHQQHQARSTAVEEVDYVEKVQSLEFVFFATGVAAISQIISSLDELHRITKVLCGEIPFKGFESWKNEFDRVHSAA